MREIGEIGASLEIDGGACALDERGEERPVCGGYVCGDGCLRGIAGDIETGDLFVAEAERGAAGELRERAVDAAVEGDGLVFRSLHEGGDQAVGGAGDGGCALEHAGGGPFGGDVGAVVGALQRG